MMKKLLGALAFVASSMLLMGQIVEPYPSYLGSLPAATLPLGGNEQFYVLQGGLSKNITATTLLNSNPLLPAGIPQNVLNTQTTTYTIATTDCGKTVQAGTGSTGFFAITLPGVSGFPTTCVVSVKNADTSRGKQLNNFPTDIAGVNQILYPLQTVSVGIVGGTWQTLQNPGRWRPPSTPTIFVDGTNGNDSNDGLAAGTGNAFFSIAQAARVLSAQVDLQGGLKSATISLASGQTWTNSSLNLTATGPINLTANGGTFTGTSSALFVNCSAPTSGGSNCLTIANAVITCSGGGAGLNVASGIVALGSNLTFGACVGGSHIVANGSLAQIQIGASYTVSGGGFAHLISLGGGYINFQAGSAVTVTLTGTPTFTGAFADADTGSRHAYSNVTFSGPAIGPRYSVNHGSAINTAGGGPNFFPGSTPGAVAKGGSYDSPGTPTITAGCNVGAAVTAGSTDQSGSLVTGSGGSSTTCTITFTTANNPVACTASTNSSLVAIGVAPSPTTLVFAYTSSTNVGIDYSCPANP